MVVTPGPRMKPRVWNRKESAICVVLSERSIVLQSRIWGKYTFSTDLITHKMRMTYHQ